MLQPERWVEMRKPYSIQICLAGCIFIVSKFLGVKAYSGMTEHDIKLGKGLDVLPTNCRAQLKTMLRARIFLSFILTLQQTSFNSIIFF